MDKIKELEKNLIIDFDYFLKENNYKISTIPIVNENYINNYLMSIFYNLFDNLENYEEIKKIENEFYNILDNYCKNGGVKNG